MKDRVSANPGRVLITPEDGSAPFYATLAMEDNPIVEGTPLNKASLLTDATAALFGLESNAVPNDVLSIVGSQIGGFKVVNSYQITPMTTQSVSVDLNSFDPTKMYYLRMTANDTDNNSIYLVSFSASASGSNSYQAAAVIHFKQGIFNSDSNYYISGRFGYHPETFIPLLVYNYPDEITGASIMGWSDEETLRWVGIRTNTSPLRVNFSCRDLSVGTINLELLERLV